MMLLNSEGIMAINCHIYSNFQGKSGLNFKIKSIV